MPRSRFTKGARVLVVEGASRGDVGEIRGLSKFTFGDEAVWDVQLDETGWVSHIRESFLVPEPRKSDEDVLGPLRNNVSG